MSTVLIALLFLLNALLMPLVVELVKERAPGLALRVMTLAVRLLPRAHRDRYRQECPVKFITASLFVIPT